MSRKVSVDAGFGEICRNVQSGNFSNPKWQFLEPKVAISRTSGGNFSNPLELVTFYESPRRQRFLPLQGGNFPDLRSV